MDHPLARLAKPYRDQLEARWKRLDEQIGPLEEQVDQVHERARAHLEALEAKVPETSGNPTDIEWLTRRAAQADLDLAIRTRDVAVAEANINWCKVVAERDDIEVRIGQVDHLAEHDDPVLSPGNDDQLAMWTLEAQESAFDLAASETVLQFARRRLDHAKKAHREIHAALRKRQAAARASKK